MTEEDFIDGVASQIAENEYGLFSHMANHPIIMSRLRKVARKIVKRVQIRTLSHVRRNLETFAISQGYEPGEDNISFEMVFSYLDLETGKAMVELAAESKK